MIRFHNLWPMHRDCCSESSGYSLLLFHQKYGKNFRSSLNIQEWSWPVSVFHHCFLEDRQYASKSRETSWILMCQYHFQIHRFSLHQAIPQPGYGLSWTKWIVDSEKNPEEWHLQSEYYLRIVRLSQAGSCCQKLNIHGSYFDKRSNLKRQRQTGWTGLKRSIIYK